MSTVETASLLTELAGGRRPQWVEQTTVDGPPNAVNSGVDLLMSGLPALVTAIAIQLRADVWRRSGVITVVPDGTATFSFYLAGLSGTPVSYTASGSDTDLDILNGLKTALEAETNHNDRLTATVNATTKQMTIIGKTGSASKGWESWSMASITATGGGGGEEIAIDAEPDSAIFHVFGLPAGIQANSSQPSVPIETWYSPALISGVRTGSEVDWQGYVDTLNTGSLARLYVEIRGDSLAGPSGETSTNLTYMTPRVFIGPCGRESAQTGA